MNLKSPTLPTQKQRLNTEDISTRASGVILGHRRQRTVMSFNESILSAMRGNAVLYDLYGAI